MGFRLAVSGGAENINLDEKTIQKVTFSSDSATDSNARATDFGIAVKITGKMLYKVGAEDRKSTRLNSSHPLSSRMPSSA